MRWHQKNKCRWKFLRIRYARSVASHHGYRGPHLAKCPTPSAELDGVLRWCDRFSRLETSDLQAPFWTAWHVVIRWATTTASCMLYLCLWLHIIVAGELEKSLAFFDICKVVSAGWRCICKMWRWVVTYKRIYIQTHIFYVHTYTYVIRIEFCELATSWWVGNLNLMLQ